MAPQGITMQQLQMTVHAADVLALLESADEPMLIAQVARGVALPPTLLTLVLDELHDAGLVEPGNDRSTVRLVRKSDGRFAR